MVACWRIISFGANFGENSHHIDGHYCHVCTKPKSTSWNISMVPIFYNIFIGPIFLNILTVSKCWWFDHIDGTMFSGGEGPYCHIQECSTLFFLGCEHHRPCFRVLGFLVVWLLGWFSDFLVGRWLVWHTWLTIFTRCKVVEKATVTTSTVCFWWFCIFHQQLSWETAPMTTCTTSETAMYHITLLQTTLHTLPNYTENTVPCPTCLLWCLTINI